MLTGETWVKFEVAELTNYFDRLQLNLIPLIVLIGTSVSDIVQAYKCYQTVQQDSS